MNVGKMKKQGHDLLQVYDEGGSKGQVKRQLKCEGAILASFWVVMMKVTGRPVALG